MNIKVCAMQAVCKGWYRQPSVDFSLSRFSRLHGTLLWIGNMLVLQEAIMACNKIQRWVSQGVLKEISYLLFFQ